MYPYKDHLGNIRINYAWDDEANELTVLNEHHYYPFGLEHAAYNTTKREFKRGGSNNHPIQIIPVENAGYQYKYNGKELQDELGLNLYDYGARNYDAALGRWMNVDPLSELAYSYSPNSYVFNNPVYFNDPTGMIGEAFTDYYDDGKGNVIYDPNVHDPSDVPDGGTYIGPTYTDPETGTFWDENGKPHSPTQEIDEVVIIGSASGKHSDYNADIGIWGYSRNNVDNVSPMRKGYADHTIDAPLPSGGGATVGGWLKLIQWLSSFFVATESIVNEVNKKTGQTKSTMKKKAKEEAKNTPPQIKVHYRNLYHNNDYFGKRFDGAYTDKDTMVYTKKDSVRVKKQKDSIYHAKQNEFYE